MRLRKLESKDAPLMLEWMHDEGVVRDLNRDFSRMTIEDCECFIAHSVTNKNIHMAIVNDEDIYMGTVSLKGIDYSEKVAEFGITVRTVAMGRGFSIFAMKEIFNIAKEKGIDRIFWCVSGENTRALRFYDKNGYERVDFSMIAAEVDYPEEKIKSFVWYMITI